MSATDISAIEEIYLALANLELGGVKSRNLPEVKLQVRLADLPLRILVPSTTGELSFIAIGTLNKITWDITDLCLWAPLSGGGIEQYAAPMMDYVKSYLSEIKNMRNPTSQSNIVGLGVELGPTPWADSDYWAIRMNLAIEEVL